MGGVAKSDLDAVLLELSHGEERVVVGWYVVNIIEMDVGEAVGALCKSWEVAEEAAFDGVAVAAGEFL